MTEFRASGAAPNPNLTVTELTSPQLLAKTSTTDTIVPSLIGTGGRVPPDRIFSNDASSGNVETSGAFDPAEDGLDFWESFEGMLVQMNNLLATSFTFTNFGEVFVLGDNGANASVISPAGSVVISAGDLNPERIVIDDEWFKAGGPAAMPAVNVGGTFPGAHVGILDWAFGEYRIQLRDRPTVGSTGISVRESTVAAGTDEVSVATFNVENLSGGEADAKYNALAAMIVNNLASPDILGLEEIQDNNGAVGGTSSPVVDANVTLDRLIAAIQAAGGPTYAYRQINPVAHQDGGEPGGNIRVGFLYRTDRGLAFVDRPGGDSTTAVSVVSTPERAAAVDQPGSDRAHRRGVELEPQAAGGRVHLQRPHAVRDRQPLQLEGRRPAAVRPVAAADVHVGGAAEQAGDARGRLRQRPARCRSGRRTWRSSATSTTSSSPTR